jgi:hypothetical protein
VTLLLIWLAALIIGVNYGNGNLWRLLFWLEIWFIGKFGKLKDYD